MMARKIVFCLALVLLSWSNVRAAMMVEEGDGGEGEEEGSPEYLFQFQELLRCTMGIDGIMALLEKFNCTECQRCFKNWNTGYYNLNQRPICENFEGQLYTLSYEYDCFEDGSARCIKTPNRCHYETCKLDTKFVTCLQSLNPAKLIQ